MEKIYDVVIIGGGPAGLTAAIYAGRSNLSVLVVEKEGLGSLALAHLIENYPGYREGISGKDLLSHMREHAQKYNVEFLDATFLGIDIYSDPYKVQTNKINVGAKSIILALGVTKSTGKKIIGEEEFVGNGVSYCATCDGAFTRGRIVALFGQGEELGEEALFLTKFSKEINIFINDEKFNCSKEILEVLEANENVNIYLNAHVKELMGSEYLENARIEIDGEEKEFPLDYAFMYLGTKNPTELLGEFMNLDSKGFVLTNETMNTNVEGIFVAGDMVSKKVRQITTATNDGTIAGMEAIKYLLTKKSK